MIRPRVARHDPLGEDLRRLRRRLTAVFAATTTAVLVLFVLMLVRTSTTLEQRRLDSDLTGAASRATALIYDDDGRTRLDGVTDDMLASSGLPLLITQHGPGDHDRVLLELGSPDRRTAIALARRAIAGPPDRPTFATLPAGGSTRRAVAMPWVHDDDTIGGAVVVSASEPVDLSTNRLLLPAVAGAASVLVVLAGLAWVVAGRSLRPAAAALADRERFLSTAAHELRRPLARLRAGAEAARRVVRPGEPAAEALHHLVTVADSAARVVSNLLLATRAGQGNVDVRQDPVDLAALAGELELTYPTMLVDVAEPVVVRGDPALLRHALGNLADNALRYGRVGPALPQVDVRVRRDRGTAVVQVIDDGPGFPRTSTCWRATRSARVVAPASGCRSCAGSSSSTVADCAWVSDRAPRTHRPGARPAPSWRSGYRWPRPGPRRLAPVIERRSARRPTGRRRRPESPDAGRHARGSR